jgi:predicted metal-binding membrane protein
VLACFAGGYLAVWALFGGAALVFDDVVHRLTHAIGWLGAHPEVVAAATLGLAGAFQLSTLKDRCLTALMAYEKIGRHGPAVATATGILALAVAPLVAAQPTWIPW